MLRDLWISCQCMHVHSSAVFLLRHLTSVLGVHFIQCASCRFSPVWAYQSLCPNFLIIPVWQDSKRWMRHTKSRHASIPPSTVRQRDCAVFHSGEMTWLNPASTLLSSRLSSSMGMQNHCNHGGLVFKPRCSSVSWLSPEKQVCADTRHLSCLLQSCMLPLFCQLLTQSCILFSPVCCWQQRCRLLIIFIDRPHGVDHKLCWQIKATGEGEGG